MSMEFDVAKRRREPIPFHLSIDPDFEYEFLPPKDSKITLAIASGDNGQIAKNMLDWITDGLPDDQAQHLIEVFEDNDNDFDTEAVIGLLRMLQGQEAGRPTTSPDGSSASPTGTGRSSTGGRRRKAATSSA